MEINPSGFVFCFGIVALIYLGGVGFVASGLNRIAKALEEVNKLQNRP